MANAITTTIEWNGKETLEFFLDPIFIGTNPLDTDGIRVMTDVQSKKQLNYFGILQKITKAYVKGFNPSTGAVYDQRTLEVVQMKAEIAQDANEFYQTVYEQAQNKGWRWNMVDGTILATIVTAIFRDAVRSDAFRQAWLNDTNKETVVADVPSGIADVDYDAYVGFWQRFIDDSKLRTDPAFVVGVDIPRVEIDNGAVAFIGTITVTGTSGTANYTFNSIDYLATFDADLNTTAANFVTAHAAALLLRGIVISNVAATDVIDVTTTDKGWPVVQSAANVSGDLDGVVATVTPETPADPALSADEALNTFTTMWNVSDPVLKQQKRMTNGLDGGTNQSADNLGLLLWVTDSMLENYLESLEGFGTTELAYMATIGGVDVPKWRNIPVIAPGWDQYLEADFINQFPNRAILSVRENVVYGVDAISEQATAEFWYNKDEQENRYRIQYKAGTQYVHAQFITVGF